MNATLLEEVVQAVLYEGYILYPYRASSKKNARERFTFGRVYPEVYSQAQGGAEPCAMQTECLLKPLGPEAGLQVSVRFLHPLARQNGTPAQTWHEAVEREIQWTGRVLPEPAEACESRRPGTPAQRTFSFPALREEESISEAEDPSAGPTLRRQKGVAGNIEVTISPAGPGLFKATVRVTNQTPVPESELLDPEAVLLRTFASTHVVLHVSSGEFISATSPPTEHKPAAAACKNIGAWPVLIGDEQKGERDTMLASPIILCDYPKIAPQSAGPLFDSAEIDELLTLRIMTMTEEEKSEMRQVDAVARRLLERTEALPESALLKMHGTMRRAEPDRRTGAVAGVPGDVLPSIEFDDFFGPNTRLESVTVGGSRLRTGDRVRIRPKARADVMDLALEGQVAQIEAIEQDLEKRIHLALVLENDPGKDLGFLRQPGHRFFFGLEEVEPL